jgi:hypothetical protein
MNQIKSSARQCPLAVPQIFLVIALAAMFGGCSGGSSTAPSPRPAPAGLALWVPNFGTSGVSEFLRNQLKSGTPDPQITSVSNLIDSPEAVTFDKNDNLWVTNCTDPTLNAGSIVEFERAKLASLSNNPPSRVVLTDNGNYDYLDCPYGAKFDSSGNLWVVNRFYPDLVEYTSSQLSTGGAQPPNTVIQSFEFGDPEGIVFDNNGTLWIADISYSQISGFKAETLAANSGQSVIIDPDIVNTSSSLNGVAAVAFDAQGNQWAANCDPDTIVEFRPGDIAASGSPTPAVTISSTSVTTASGTDSSLLCPEGLAFDKQGNLWVANLLSNNAGSIAEFTADQLTASGNPVPAVFIESNPSDANLSNPVLLSFGPAVR